LSKFAIRQFQQINGVAGGHGSLRCYSR
jgi:hypothetical protein